MVRLLLVLAASMPLAATAATRFSVAELAEADDELVNLAECEANQSVGVRWQLDGALVSGQTVTLFTHADQGCGEASAIRTVLESSTLTGETTKVTTKAQLMDGECPDTNDLARYVCLTLEGGGVQNPITSKVKVTFDTRAPAPPPTVTVTGGDGSLTVKWSYPTGEAPGDLDGFRVAHRLASSTGDPKRTEATTATAKEKRVTGLANETDYEVWVEAVDEAGNWGEGSASVLGRPQESSDFWEFYLGQGGGETGCAQGPGPAGLLALGLVLFGLRRRRGLLALLVALPLLVPAAASAGVDPERRWHFELTFGPYRPEVDSEPSLGGETPYQDIFGSGSEMLTRFRLERTVWQGVGQVGIGFGAGFAQAVGKGRLLDGGVSPDTTVFNWIPMELTATYRFDWLVTEFEVPLAAFARAGLVYDLWWILDGAGDVAVADDGRRGSGGRLGLLYGGGLQLLLDFLDPRLAADFARSSGVDNTYLVFELTRLQIDGFGRPGFNLSDTSWFLGVAIEF